MNSKGSEPDDLLMYKREIVNTIGTMGWKKSRNPKAGISACVLMNLEYT